MDGVGDHHQRSVEGGRILSAGLPPGYTPEGGPGAPGVVIFFRLYSGLMSLLSLSFAAMMIWLAFEGTSRHHAKPDAVPLVFALGFAGIATLGAAVHSVGVACPRRPWMHTFGLVILALGAMSSCMPLAIAMLIFWSKAEVKAWLEAGEGLGGCEALERPAGRGQACRGRLPARDYPERALP